MITTPTKVPAESYVSFQISCMKLVLLWPVRSKSRWTSAFLLAYFWLLVITFSKVLVGLVSKLLITKDLVDRSEAIDIFTMVLSAFYKMLFFIYRHKEFKQIVDFADENFINFPFYGSNKFTINSWMRLTKMFSIIHCFLAFFCITFWGMCPILKYLFGISSLHDMTLPMNVWYPYDFMHGYKFIPLYLMHLFGLISSAHVYMACDVFFFTLIHLACGQLQIVKFSLWGLKEITPEGFETLNECKLKGLKKCIEHHCKILSFLKKLDDLFRSMIVADVLHAIVSLSFAMLQTSESKGILEYMKTILFVWYCLIHQFLNSHFGEKIINEQQNLLSEIYGIEWYEGSRALMKTCHIMMNCSVIPIKLSAWRMYFLQYETFLEFCRTMVSVFMVLRTLRENEIIKI